MPKLLKLIIRSIIRRLPLILFPRLNGLLFRLLGYKVSRTARVYSSAQLLGDIEIVIGEKTFIGHETLITGGKSSIKIGNYCDISDRVTLVCGTHEIDYDSKRIAGMGIGKPIVIEDGVWIGSGSIILPGIKIGSKSIVGAGSVVTKDVAPGQVVAGNPAKIIRELKKPRI